MATVRRDATTGLTPLERQFIDQWIADGRGSPSASYAKVKPKAKATTASREAHRLLERAQVIAYLAKIDAKAERQLVKKTVATREWIEAKLIEIVDIGMAAVPARDRKGAETGFYRSVDLGAANVALRMLGIERGMGVEKREIGKPGEFANVTDVELEKSATERAAKLGIVIPLLLKRKK